jgi:hypothetical protein
MKRKTFLLDSAGGLGALWLGSGSFARVDELLSARVLSAKSGKELEPRTLNVIFHGQFA